ncbi:MAG: transglutaminase-like domain-containing protein [Verrucomicrobiota bacterium]|nr:transglutaminase-like domain-containing protein [Verrucomicrobiota bacterium]
MSLAVLFHVSCVEMLRGDDVPFDQGTVLVKAGSNVQQIRLALDTVEESQREGLEFLLRYMPQRDLTSLSSEFLLEHVRFAYTAWKGASWAKQVPKDIFLNNILPYVSINERRDAWRKGFYEHFQSMIKGLESPGMAAARLNQVIFPMFGVKYSTKRKKADQSPFETLESGLASCTGLSIMLIDACRAVGIPARFVGTPLWSDGSGNHSWVEIWDNGWHFTGAAEPVGDALDRAWFTGRAAKADGSSHEHAIYAVSYRHTPIPFPMVWKRGADYVYSVNVTDRYTALDKSLPKGYVHLMLRTVDETTGNRCSSPVQLQDQRGQVVFEGTTKDERFDANDHLTAAVKRGTTYQLSIPLASGERLVKTLTVETGGQMVQVEVPSDE